ncbi:MAG TPA: matrixin family metalloprotease, partial [Minicystis sp.]|nr:matrixin family metalloprotease [Minicystis sp.]
MTKSSRAALALGLAVLAAPAPAAAFCRTSTCGAQGTSQVCTPAGPGDCGKPLFWPSPPCIGYWLQKDASREVSLDAARQVFDEAFATWAGADCGGGAHPSLVVKDAGTVACHTQEYNESAGNANVIMFDDDTWPYEGSSNTLALTTVTYDVDTGEIYDADMELNSAQVQFTTGDTGIEFDLPSIAQHETGHFLGLAHSQLSDATMFATYKQGDTSLRTLAADDVAAICAVYPPGTVIDP